MHKEFKKIINAAKQATLSKDEKALLFGNIKTFVDEHPISHIGRVTATPSPYFGFSFMFAQSRFVAFALVLFVVLGGGTSLAAQNSVPGDTLYTIKMNIEAARASLTFSDKGKASVEAARAEERLKEAETLAVRGTLTPENKTIIEDNFTKHAQAAEERIAAIANKGDLSSAIDLSTKFEASLKTHENALSTLDSKEQKEPVDVSRAAKIITSDSVQSEVSGIANIVRSKIDSSVSARENVENQITSISTSGEDQNKDALKQAAELKLLHASIRVKDVELYITDNKLDVNQKNVARALEMKAQAVDLIAQGQEKRAQALYADAFDLFKRAFKLADDARMMIDIEVQMEDPSFQTKPQNDNASSSDQTIQTKPQIKPATIKPKADSTVKTDSVKSR